MEQLICRTCLTSDLLKTSFINVLNKVELIQITVKDMLEVFIPEMDLDISDGVSVVCFPCSESLINAYKFKSMCLRTEEKVYNYLHNNNIQLGQKICLNKVLDEESDSQVKFSTTFNTINLEHDERNSNSDQSYSLFDKVNEETKVALRPQRTRKRKRRTQLKKTIKDLDYNVIKRSYTCDMCEYKAYRLDLLNTHKLKHDKNLQSIKKYKCDLCMYSTPRKRALDRHLFTHKRKSEHVCEVCDKTFAEKYRLKLHAITHTGQELPHKCEDCGKGYLTKSYLKQHMETRHLAQKKTDCQECSQPKCDHTFTRFYKCNMCESSFSDKRGLDAHKFTHTGGEFPFKCLHCDFSTAWKGNLRKHFQNKH